MDTSRSMTVLSTHPERPAISQGGCRLNVLLRLNAPPLARTRSERQPVALAVVIDRSGSMAGAKLQAACVAAQQLVRPLRPADRLSVISFDDEVRTVVPLSPPSEEVITRIGRIRSGGQTALFDGWRAGMESLLQAEDLQHHQKRVLLLTDGQANVGLRRRSEVAPWVGTAQESAISTSCIGLGDDYEERLLIAMAEAGGGNLVHLTAPQQLEAIFQAELEGLNLTLGRDLRLRVSLAEGVALERLYNPIEPTADGWIPLGSLQAGTTPTLALQLRIAPGVAAAAGDRWWIHSPGSSSPSIPKCSVKCFCRRRAGSANGRWKELIRGICSPPGVRWKQRCAAWRWRKPARRWRRSGSCCMSCSI